MVPAGGAAVALLDTAPVNAVTFAITVKVTLPPDGSTGMTMPDCNCATVGETGHWAPPLALPQLTLVFASPATAESVRTAPSAACGPALLTTIV